MARPLEKDYGAKQTTITLPFEIWESLRKENINVSEECAKHLTSLIKHPGFRQKLKEKERLNEILQYVDPDFLKSMRKHITKDKNTALHWQKMLKKNYDVDISKEDLLNWAFETWKK